MAGAGGGVSAPSWLPPAGGYVLPQTMPTLIDDKTVDESGAPGIVGIPAIRAIG